MIQDGQEHPPGQSPKRRGGSAPVTRILRVDANGRVVRDPEDDRARDRDVPADTMSLADLLPESASIDLVAAIRAAADTGNAQFLEFDLLSAEGVRRIHAEATPDPERQGEFVVIAREYSSPETLDMGGAVERFAASAAAADDLGAMFQELAGVLAGLLTYDRLAIVRVDRERDEQYVIFSTDPDQEAIIPLSGTAIEVVSRTGEPLVVPAAIPSVIVVPLRWSGETIAYMGVHSKAWESYGDHDLRAVAGLGPSVASALAADRHRKYMSRLSAEDDALHSISAIAAAAGDLSTILEVTADRIHRLGRFSGVRVEAAATTAYAISGPEAIAIRGDAPPPQADRTHDKPGDPSWIIGATAEPMGTISVRPSGVGAIDENDRRLLSESALRLAQGIGRIGADREIDRLKVDLDCTREIDRVTAGLSDLDTLIAVAADKIMRLADPESLVISVNRLDSEQVRLELRLTAVTDDYAHPSPEKSPEDSREETAAIPLLGPDGAIGRISATWRSNEDARTGVRRMEAMTPRLAERVHSLLLLERSAIATRDARCLAEIEAAIERSAEPGLALEEASSVLCDRFGGARVAVALLDDNGTTLSELTVSGFPVPGWAAGVTRPAEGSLEEAALLATGPVSSSRATPDALVARWPAEASAVGAGIRSFASVALPSGGAISACLSARSPDDAGLSDNDLDLLRRAATLITGPTLRLATEAVNDGSSSELTALARIGQISQSGQGAEIPYARLTAELACMVKFDQVEIATLTPDGKAGRRVYLGGKPVPGWEPDSEFPLPGTVTEAVIRSRTGLFVGNESPAELAGRFPAQAAALAADLHSFAAAPLVIDEEPAGSLVVRSTDPAAYSQRELSIVEAVAVHLSAAIARGLLRKQIERQRREREAIASIGFASSWDLEPEVIAERAATAYGRLVDCDGFVVTAVSADADAVRVVFAPGLDEVNRRFFADRLNRLEPGPGHQNNKDRDGYASSLRARIGPLSRPLGYMHAFASRPDAFNADDADLLERMAEQLGAVFERVRASGHSSSLSAEQELRRRLDQQNRELKDLTASRDRFLRMIVHELHIPLMSVQLLTDTLMQNTGSNLGEEQIAQLAQIADDGERLKGLIANLLDVSQIESDTFKLAPEEFDAGPMIRDLCDGFGALLAARGQRIELSRPNEPLWLRADPKRLSSVLSNLINNACKYSDDGAVVRIEVERDGSRLEVAVADSGIGISAEDLDTLFTPFFRGTNPAVLRQPGTGLGLVIARSIVRLHGGDLSLESEPGRGTTARFHIEGLQDGPSEAYQAAAAVRDQNGEAG